MISIMCGNYADNRVSMESDVFIEVLWKNLYIDMVNWDVGYWVCLFSYLVSSKKSLTKVRLHVNSRCVFNTFT